MLVHSLNILSFTDKILIFIPSLLLWLLICYLIIIFFLKQTGSTPVVASNFSHITFFLGLLVLFNVIFLPEMTFLPNGSPEIFFSTVFIVLLIGLYYLFGSDKNKKDKYTWNVTDKRKQDDFFHESNPFDDLS